MIRADLIQRWMIAVLSIVIIALLLTVFKLATAPKAIYAIPGLSEAGTYEPNTVTRDQLDGFAARFLYLYTTFTPATIEDQFSKVRTMMDPLLLAQFDGERQAKVDKVVNGHMAEMFFYQPRDVRAVQDKPFVIRFEGIKAVYVAGSVVKEIPYFYQITVRTSPAVLVSWLDQGELPKKKRENEP